MKLLLIATALFLSAATAHAGEVSLGVNFGSAAGNNGDIDELIKSANSSATTGPISTGDIGSAWEVTGVFGYRFDGSIMAVHLQPSFFFVSTDGAGQTGTFEYGLNGAVIMPLFRFYPLENDFMSIYFQFGVGWGYLDGEIKEGTETTEFGGSNLGYQAGLGVNMCYSKMHCLNLEANFRNLSIDRNIVDASDSGGTHTTGRITQAITNQELEIDGRDFKTGMSGFVAQLGYIFKF